MVHQQFIADALLSLVGAVRAWVQGIGIIKSGFLLVNGQINLEFSDSPEVCVMTLGAFELDVSSDKP
jgi:hypothetical protein